MKSKRNQRVYCMRFCDIHNNQDLCRLIKLAETLIRPDITKIESSHN